MVFLQIVLTACLVTNYQNYFKNKINLSSFYFISLQIVLTAFLVTNYQINFTYKNIFLIMSSYFYKNYNCISGNKLSKLLQK